MSFVSPAQGQRVLHSHVTQLINALTGVSGAAEALAFTSLSNSSSYALDLRNLDGTNSYGLRVRDSSSNDLFKVYLNNIVIGSAATHITTIYGNTFIGDTSNTAATLGLTINQGAADNEGIALKSSDVDHGMVNLGGTDATETDTYGRLLKSNGATGGLAIHGLSEATTGLALGGMAVTDSTGKNTAPGGYVQINAYKKTGTTIGDCGANANLLTVANNATTRFIFDAEGSGHADVEFTTFDKYDDIAMLDALNTEFEGRRDTVRAEFGAFLTDHATELEEAGIVGKDSWHLENGRPHAMINFTKLAMLHTGALRQIGKRQGEIAARLVAVEQQIKALPKGA